jgi:CubicO group peptidase (beta-lactamase class C family)
MDKHRISELNSKLKTRLDEILSDRVTEQHCPSVFASLFQGQESLLQAGFGESRIGAGPPGPETVFRIASCSKSFTATMLMILRDRGLLDLDSPISKFVPEFTQASAERVFDPPTIRMLMSMSSGLPSDDPWADRQESISNEALRSIASKGVYLTAAPGVKFQYSNLGYALLGQVVEVVTGRSFREVVNEEILLPLELHETGYEKEIVKDDQLARGYRKGADGWVELEYSGPGAFSCIGGLFSCGRDLAQWVRWFAGANDDEFIVTGPLSVTSRREMQQIVTVIDHGDDLAATRSNSDRYYGYGLGLFSEFDKRYGHFVSHSGGYPGFSSHMRWHAPTGLGVVVLENATYSGAWGTATRLLEQVLEDLDFRLPNVDVWTMTAQKAEQANSLIRKWDNELAAQVFEENVALDIPYSERRQQIEGLVGELGGLSDSMEMQIKDGSSDSPLHMIWTIPAARGSILCEIRLSPKTPSLILSLLISKDLTSPVAV